jgi:adenylate cyclase
MSVVYRLRFFGGEHDGETYIVDKNHGAIMGRSPTNTVYVRDKNVSRVHCQITVTDKGVIISDLQSTNGTFVNELRITEQMLKPGDEARIGLTSFRLEEMPEPDQGASETHVL